MTEGVFSHHRHDSIFYPVLYIGKLRNSEILVTLPTVTKQVCPRGTIETYSHFPKDRTRSFPLKIQKYSSGAFAMSALIWEVLIFAHLQSWLHSLLPWMF